MKSLLAVLWHLLRFAFLLTRFLVMKLILGPVLYFLRPFFAAVRYLTILPVPQAWAPRATDLQRARVHLPLVGIVLGVLVGAFACCTPMVFPDLLSSALIVAAMVLLGRARALEGLGRGVDLLAGPQPRQHALDKAVGGLGGAGTAAVGCALLLKLAALAKIENFARWRAAMLIPLAGQCAMVVALSVVAFVPLPQDARPEGFRLRERSRLGGILCAVWAGLILVAAAWWVWARFPDPRGLLSLEALRDSQWWLAGFQGIVAAVVCVAAALLAGWFLRRRLGGTTHLTLLAVCELGEVLMAVMLGAYEIREYFWPTLWQPPRPITPQEEALWFQSIKDAAVFLLHR